jgi:predicted GIY-YIG superfamily endonuclease
MVEQRPFKALVVGSSPTQPRISPDMAWVYILRGPSGRYYIGSTENLTRRLAEHRRGGNHTTHRFGGDLEVVISRVVDNRAEARRIELALKRKKNPRVAIQVLKGLP